MGRPLKIQKYSTNSGIGSPGAAVGIDVGFPNFGSLTDPEFNVNPTTLSNADFRYANLQSARLDNATMMGTDLRGANLTCASLENAFAVASKFCSAQLYDTNFRGAYLGNANLDGAFWDGADFTGANLIGVTGRHGLLRD